MLVRVAEGWSEIDLFAVLQVSLSAERIPYSIVWEKEANKQ